MDFNNQISSHLTTNPFMESLESLDSDGEIEGDIKVPYSDFTISSHQNRFNYHLTHTVNSTETQKWQSDITSMSIVTLKPQNCFQKRRFFANENLHRLKRDMEFFCIMSTNARRC